MKEVKERSDICGHVWRTKSYEGMVKGLRDHARLRAGPGPPRGLPLHLWRGGETITAHLNADVIIWPASGEIATVRAMRFIVGALIVVAIVCGLLMLVSSAALGTWTEHLAAIAILCLAFALGIEVFGGSLNRA